MSKAPLARVQREWGRRVEAEYRSAAITSELTLWLIRVGVSPDLIEDGLRIVSDELTHARMSHVVFAAAGGDEASAPMRSIDRATLGIARFLDEPLENDVIRACVQTFCLGETIAVPLFSHLRRECTAESAREALDRILVDEVRHRDFGWELLDWMLATGPRDTYSELIRRELPGFFAALESAYGRSNPATAEEAVTPEERTWGLAAPSDYAEILERTISRDYIPRFADLGLDAAAAWEARPR